MAGKLFFEVFSGSGRLSRALARAGIESWGYDVADGPSGDLLRAEVASGLEEAILGGKLLGLHFGTPCHTWSRARRNDGKGPGPLRDDGKHLWGFPMHTLSAKDQLKLSIGNRLTRTTLKLIRMALEAGLIVILENTMTSRLWLIKQLQKLIKPEKHEPESALVDLPLLINMIWGFHVLCSEL